MLLFNVVCFTVVLGPVVSLDDWSGAPEEVELIMALWQWSQWTHMPMALVHLG
jgi:hypothetical protein